MEAYQNSTSTFRRFQHDQEKIESKLENFKNLLFLTNACLSLNIPILYQSNKQKLK